MDVFIEKIVTRKKTSKEHLIVAGIVLGGLILSILSFILLGPISPAVVAAILYFGYYFVKGTNLEYEYAVTNGDIDVDKIIAQRKRKRVFSAYTKDVEIIARLKSDKYNEYKNINKRVEAVSSMNDAQDIYFMVAPFKSERTILFFQPDQRMLDSFKTKLPPYKFFEY